MSEVKTYSIPVKTLKFEESGNEQFLKTKFFAIAEGENLNRSSFTIGGMENCIATNDYTFKPILGSWDKNKISEAGFGDFGGHDSDVVSDAMSGEVYNTYLGEKNERPLGLILPNTAKIEDFKGRKWLTFEGLIWSQYNREAVRLLKKKRTNNVSVEIRVLDNDYDDNDIEIIKSFSLLGITIIGVDAGIPNACLNILDFTATPQYSNFVQAFSKESHIEDEQFLKQDKFGSGDALKLDLSKESASADEWGAINKSKLRNSLLRAKNYKSIIPKSYLVVEDGWEDAPSDKLKYPVVQIKDGKVVLNENGVKSAGSFLMKEKDASYFKKAKAKLAKLRRILGMEKLMSLEFGLETDEDWDGDVSQQQPSIIKMNEGGNDAKMDKTEMISEMSNLFENKAKLEEELKQCNSLYEEKLGEYEYAEDDNKEALKAEMDVAKESADAKETEVKTCERSILDMAKAIAEYKDESDDTEDVKDDDADDEDKVDDADKGKDNNDDKDAEDIKDVEDVDDEDEDKDDKDYPAIDEEEEEEPIDIVGEDKFACIEGYVCNSKNYIIYEKDNELYAAKYECGEDGKVAMAEDAVKCEQVFVRFKVGGPITVEDEKSQPAVKVAIANGLARAYASLKAEKARADEADAKLLAKDEEKAQYAVDVKSMLAKYAEVTDKEDVDKDFQESIYEKIFNGELKDAEVLEEKVMAHLYKTHSQKGILGGNFVRKATESAEAKTECDKINEFLKNFK